MRYIFGMMIVAISVLLMSGCATKKKPVSYGKPDPTPYDIRECTQQLALGAELDKSKKADKIVVHKGKRLMQVFQNGKMVKETRLSLGKNHTGNKLQQGDYKTPEGRYQIVGKKCHPKHYKSFLLSYPNAEDIARAKKMGVNPGGLITIHAQPKWNADGRGDEYTLSHDWTEGCIAIPNKAMDYLWASVARGTTIEIHP